MTENQEPPSPPGAGRSQAFGLALLTVGAIIALVALSPQRSNPVPDIKQVSAEVETAETTGSDAQGRESLADDSAEPRPLGTFPDWVERAPMGVRDAYTFVADPDSHELIQSLKCYCGCDAGLEHRSLFDCFIKELRPGNQAIYSDHGIGCLTCVSEVWDAANWKAAGKTPAEIKDLIDSNYGARVE